MNILKGLGIFTMLIFIVVSCGKEDGKSAKSDSSELSNIRKSNITDEVTVVTPGFHYTNDNPGKSKKIERSFENAPPLIPHSIENFPPITKESNLCTSCHMPEFAKNVKATPISKSHLFDLSSGTPKDLKGKLNMTFYNCTICHVPQAVIDPAVKSNFKREFRSEKGKTSSNLIEKYSEGVKIK
ncbi:MAG: nitrate reductase cytochrome c-type subunit [Spirochaetota bacterium]|nr:nitrate reductase cytochrome c-type subunit [Spirochaetota bacterium]